MKTFRQWLEAMNGDPETDTEAKLRLPNDPRIHAMYDQARKKGANVNQAWTGSIGHNWGVKKARGQVLPNSAPGQV